MTKRGPFKFGAVEHDCPAQTGSKAVSRALIAQNQWPTSLGHLWLNRGGSLQPGSKISLKVKCGGCRSIIVTPTVLELDVPTITYGYNDHIHAEP